MVDVMLHNIPKEKIKEPAMFVIQLDLRDAPNICGNGLEAAVTSLGSFATAPVEAIFLSVAIIGRRNGYLDLSKEMTKEIADELFQRAVINSKTAHIRCGCNAKFNLRLEKTN